MSATREDLQADDALVLEYALDAPPEKVWRAVSIPAFRERWLPDGDLAEASPVFAVEGTEISYRMRDGALPGRESLVTFAVSADGAGGSRLRIVHQPADSLARRPAMSAANGNRPPTMMLAA